MYQGRKFFHAYQDRAGMLYSLVLWDDVSHLPFDKLLQTIASQGLSVLCGNLQELDCFSELLNSPHASPFASSRDGLMSFSIRQKKQRGYFIFSDIWIPGKRPDIHVRKEIDDLFHLIGYQSLSPGGLSEKILRATLPQHLFIRRPSHMMRDCLLGHHKGGRIEKAKKAYYRHIYEYDLNKAYLSFSSCVPSPFETPVFTQGERLFDFSCAWMHIKMIAHANLHPIQIRTKSGSMRLPHEGETLDLWLWDQEIRDCLDAGYTLLSVEEGYGWHEMSNFMIPWAEILLELWERYKLPLLKKLMVALPGRFLQRPENFKVVAAKDAPNGSRLLLPYDLTREWNWCIVKEQNMESSALIQVGSYIVMRVRQEMYSLMKQEIERDNKALRAYIDSLCFEFPVHNRSIVGGRAGNWKEIYYEGAYLDGNRLVPLQGRSEAKLPGLSGQARETILKGMSQVSQGDVDRYQ